MYSPEMADERLAKPRAIAETVVVNFMTMVFVMGNEVFCLFEGV
jgi:hypothetical protein